MKKTPKEVRSIRLSRKTLDQFDKYANFIEELTGSKPNLSRTSDEALNFYTRYRLLSMANEMARVIQNIKESQNQKGNEPEEEAN